MTNVEELFLKASELKYSSTQKLQELAKQGDCEALYRLGKLSYDENCYDDAENYWEKAARNGHNRAKKALLNLYKNELKDKYDYTSRTSYAEAKGRGCRNFYDDYNKTGGYEI